MLDHEHGCTDDDDGEDGDGIVLPWDGPEWEPGSADDLPRQLVDLRALASSGGFYVETAWAPHAELVRLVPKGRASGAFSITVEVLP
jgi:hypothetical protein